MLVSGSQLLTLSMSQERMQPTPSRYAQLASSFTFGQAEHEIKPFFRQHGWDLAALQVPLEFAQAYQLPGRR